MLDVSSTAAEAQLGVDFAAIFANSELYRYVTLKQLHSSFMWPFFSINNSRLKYWDYSLGTMRNSSKSWALQNPDPKTFTSQLNILKPS